MRSTAFIGFLTLVLAVPAAAQNLPVIDDLVAPYIGSDTPGMTVLVTGQGAVQHMAGYGHADLDTKAPMTPDSVFDLASVSKQFTGTAAKLLIEDDLFNRATEISEFLPDFAHYGAGQRPVVVGDLIYHVSGLPDYLDETLFDYQADTSNAQIIAWLAQAGPAHPPGIQFDYSNSGYVTLGSLVAAAAEMETLEAVLHDRVWSPLGMAKTRLGAPVVPTAAVTGYAGSDGDFEPSQFMTVAEGDGSVYTSIADLARYEKALATGSLLGTAATAELFVDGQLDDGTAIGLLEEEGYGFGWSVMSGQGDAIAYHSGSWMGTATVYLRNLDTGTSVVILANGEDFDPVDLAFEIAEAVDG